jgi:uncharacterized membrane protein YqaE (UPF0057 family)
MFDFLDGIMDPVLEPISAIATACIKGVELLVLFLEFIPKMLGVAMDIFNPTKLINDIIGGTIAAFTLIGKRIMDLVNPRTYFGSDPNIDPGKQEDIFGAKPEKDSITGKYNSPHKSKGKKCLPPTMTRMVLLMLCPPFALFLHLGLSGWISIIICSLLTVYGFYFPGLIYATLHILC